MVQKGDLVRRLERGSRSEEICEVELVARGSGPLGCGMFVKLVGDSGLYKIENVQKLSLLEQLARAAGE